MVQAGTLDDLLLTRVSQHSIVMSTKDGTSSWMKEVSTRGAPRHTVTVPTPPALSRMSSSAAMSSSKVATQLPGSQRSGVPKRSAAATANAGGSDALVTLLLLTDATGPDAPVLLLTDDRDPTSPVIPFSDVGCRVEVYGIVFISNSSASARPQADRITTKTASAQAHADAFAMSDRRHPVLYLPMSRGFQMSVLSTTPPAFHSDYSSSHTAAVVVCCTFCTLDSFLGRGESNENAVVVTPLFTSSVFE